MDVGAAMDAFRDGLTERGLKFTKQRHAIASTFFRADAHLSLPEILDLAKGQLPSVGYATVYRTMKLLTECGLATEHDFSEGNVRYEPNLDEHHHDHLICVKCGKIMEVEDEQIERLQEELAARLGFKVVNHRHEIYGECLRNPCPENAKAVAGRWAGN